MSKTNILVLGHSQDVMVSYLQKRFQAHSYAVTVLETLEVDELPSFSVFNMVIDLRRPAELLDLTLFALEELLDPETIVLTSVWTGLPTQLATQCCHPNRILGFSPLAFVLEKPVVELVPASQAKSDLLAQAQQLFEACELEVLQSPETSGFIFPRILAMITNEATSAVMEGVATPADIDTAMKLGTNYPEGPLAWGDKIGLDIIEALLKNLYDAYREDRYRPMPLLKYLIDAGKAGVHQGQGFFNYTPERETV